MARHEHQSPTEAPAMPAPDQAARLAELDRVFVKIVTTAGLPVPLADPFPVDYFNTATPEQVVRAVAILNWAHRSGVIESLKDILKTKDVRELSDTDQAEYAKAYGNSGGVVAGLKVKPFAFPEDLTDMSLLEECIDRVRWDTLTETGVWSGTYDEHKTKADIDGRAAARAALRAGLSTGLICNPKNPKTGEDQLPDGHPMKGRTYADLVEAKAPQVLAARYAPTTRTAKPKAEAVGY